MAKTLVFGATGGIGSETARRLQRLGHDLHLVGRSAEKLDFLASELGATRSVADIEDPERISLAVAEAGSPLSGLVYAVGTINLKPLSRLTAADFERDYRLNAMGAALAVQAALPALKSHQAIGSILFFSTVAVRQGFASHASISMAKGAIEGLTRALAAELAPKVRVNAIAPSLTKTTLSAGLLAQPAMAQALGQMHPMGRLGEADDIAALAAFLMSEDAGWITGQVIGVDGGRANLRNKG